MEGVTSYEQRSSTESLNGSDEDKTRIIIVDRRAASAIDDSLPTAVAEVKTLKTVDGQQVLFSEKSLTKSLGVGGGPTRRSKTDHTLSTTGQQHYSSISSSQQPLFASNELRTSKYTVINFLPKNLFEQFRRLANFYFLVTALLQVFVPFSPVGPTTSLLPLIFVVATTAVKQAYEDYLRHKLDAEVNNRACHVLRNKRLVKVRSCDICVGDFVYVRNNEEIPADMILLAASGNSADRCYVTTANLDGETSLKPRSCFTIKEQIGGLDKLDVSLLIVECERPNATLYEFCGYVRAPRDLQSYRSAVAQLRTRGKMAATNYLSGVLAATASSNLANGSSGVAQSNQNPKSNNNNSPAPPVSRTHTPSLTAAARTLAASASSFSEVPLDTSNLLLRASRLRNTTFIYGLAIYTGKDTKLALNSQLRRNKFSSIERTVNMYLFIAFALLCLFTFVAALRHKLLNLRYLKGVDSDNSFQHILLAHFLLFNYLLPISLYVTLEFIKFIGSKSVVGDEKMRAVAWHSQTEAAAAVAAAQPEQASGCFSSNDNKQSSITGQQQQQQQSLNSSNGSSTSLTSAKRVQVVEGPKCNSSDLNEELGQVQVLFSDKTGTLTENKMVFKACSSSGQLYRSISGSMYLQPAAAALGKSHVPNVSRTLAKVATNRHSYLSGAADLRRLASAGVPVQASGGGRGHSRSHAQSYNHNYKNSYLTNDAIKLFDHRVVPPMRELQLVDNVARNDSLVGFFIAVCLCSTITLNENSNLVDCLPDRCGNDYDYQSASPDEESFISAAHQFGITLCKATDADFFLAIRRGLVNGPSASTVKPLSNLNNIASNNQNKPNNKSKHQLDQSVNVEFAPLVETRNSTDKFIVRHFKRMTVFEFNSSRKRMSVIYKDTDTDSYIMVSKGSELILDCVKVRNLSADEERVFNVTLAHFEAFAKSGLRTMLVAKRVLDENEYENIIAESKAARLSIHNREHLLALLYQHAENDLTLIGATAVEDSLQAGVPETIANLKSAGVKVWLLTGDKVETAVSVAYLCKLLDRNMVLFHLVLQKDLQSCKKLLVTYRKQMQSMQANARFEMRKSGANNRGSRGRSRPRQKQGWLWRSWLAWMRAALASSSRPRRNKDASNDDTDNDDSADDDSNDHDNDHDDYDDGSFGDAGLAVNTDESDDSGQYGLRSILTRSGGQHRFALIADGRSLYYATKYAKKDLTKLCENCTCVLGCRLSPMQKAEVVDMIKNSRHAPITAAIGDGANDVSMIQEAHVGIGVSGKEGKQAVNSSDFAIGRFHMLNRLLFVHGHLYYHRTSNTIHYFFYKNIFFIFPQFLYSFYTNSSALSLYHPFFLICFNLFFTSVPILLYGIYEVHIPELYLENFPRLYRLNKNNRLMRMSNFFTWLCLGALQAILTFYLLKYTFGSHSSLLDSGKMDEFKGISSVIYIVIIITVTFTLYSLAASHTHWFNLACIASLVLVPTLLFAYNKFGPNALIKDSSLYGQYDIYFASATFWLAVASTSLAVILPEMILSIVKQSRYYSHFYELIEQSFKQTI